MTIRIPYHIIVVGTMLLAGACGGKQESKSAGEENDTVISMEQNLPGDSMVYGLACDGCSDTLLIFLPRTGGDPDTFNILEAVRNRQIFGRPKIGDKVALIRNHENPQVADLVINLERLKGEWCYMVTPKLRERVGGGKETIPKEKKPEMDSILRQLLQPKEFGIEIKGENIARPIGISYAKADDNSPVVFPPMKRYREWHLMNGRLILSETERDSLGNATVTNNDTATFVMLHRDTLVLRFNDKEQGYYRKQ